MFATNKFINTPNTSDLLLIFFLIIIFKLIFYFTGFILEDSFIVFRSAFNLADFGKFSYNLDEINSATTSKIFGLICAFLRLLFDEYAILAIIFFNSLISFFSSLIIFFSLKNVLSEDIIKNKSNFYFVAAFVFLNPSIAIIGIVGLEFSLMVFFISLVLLGVSKDNKYLLIFCLFIPLIRIEMIGFVLIISFCFLIFLKFKNFFIIFISGLFGVFLNGFLNKIYDGSFFPGPAISKWTTLSNEDPFSLGRIVNDLHFWFFGSRSFFLGVYSKFIPTFIYTFFALIIISLSIYYSRFLLINKYKDIDTNTKIFFLTISASIILLPLSYIFGGHVWDWYLYPYSFLSYVVLGSFLISLKNKILLKKIIIFFLLSLSLLQFAVLKNIGFQENSYRSVIGKDIYDLSTEPKQDTLFLEPAGYIPYYAKIKTYDTVGLSSQEIRYYRDRNNDRWWLDFIEDKRPTFILDRSNLFDGFSHDGEYKFSKSELIWFKENYELVRKYNYHSFVEKFSGSLEAFYKMGNHSSYFLYKIK